jgi:hypothetical protein
MVDDYHDVEAWVPFLPTVSQKEFKKKNSSEPSSDFFQGRPLRLVLRTWNVGMDEGV